MEQTFHQYSIIKQLAKKYSHSTYLASLIDEPESQVVLIVFASSLFHSPRERENLLKLARQIKKLECPHLAALLDIGTGIEEEEPFVVRQYLPNGSLRSRLKQLSPNRMPLQEALVLISQVGEAIVSAHRHNIIHGNIKPENIFFDANGQAILTDFHLVDRTDAIIRDQTSEEYAFCYLAPEHFAGTRDARSDQYALACVTYELIAGRVPFAARHLPSVMSKPNYLLPAPLSMSVDDLPPSLEAAVTLALAYDPDERFFDFSLFLEVIRSALVQTPSFPFAYSKPSYEDAPFFHPMPQQQEPAEVFSQVEADIAESAATPFAFQTSEREWARIFPPSESQERLESDQLPKLFDSQPNTFENQVHQIPITSLDPLENILEDPGYQIPITPLDPLANILKDPVDEKPISSLEPEEDVMPLATASPKIFYGSSDPTVAEGILAITQSPKTARSWTKILFRSSRRRTLELGILFATIATGVCTALWLFGGITSGIPDIPKISLNPTKETQQTVNISITKVSTAQPSVLPNAMTLTALSTQVTTSLTPIGPFVGKGGSNSTVPLPSTPPPVPTPTPTASISYEAEASQNTLANGARVVGCPSGVCSGGQRVGYIGLNSGNAGTLQFNGVSKNVAGQYTLTIYYIIAGSDKLTMYISVNGGPATALNVTATADGNTVGTASITVDLNSGNNTIEFSNPSVPAPDIDRIVI